MLSPKEANHLQMQSTNHNVPLLKPLDLVEICSSLNENFVVLAHPSLSRGSEL
jgi:hypothetical protein